MKLKAILFKFKKMTTGLFPYNTSHEYKVIFEKEYKKLDKNDSTIATIMMVKDESKRIHVSLESVKEHTDALIIFDTGSVDNTTEIIKAFSEKNQINLYLIQGKFIDFSTSRNTLLDYCDKIDVHYLLLLDCNDELQGGDNLRLFAKEQLKIDCNAYLVCQKWWSGVREKYFNVRFVKNRCGWRYFGPVHEWFRDTTTLSPEPRFERIKIPDNVVLYQDRTKDDNKSGKRFIRDYEILKAEYKKNPTDSRTVFYLAQTCECIGYTDEAHYYSKIRTQMGGFLEEVFHSFMRCGNSAFTLNHDWSDCMKYYLQAYEVMNRVEPLLKISDYYFRKGIYYMAFMFVKQACDLRYPEELILFIDHTGYEYYRWHLMSLIAYYVSEFNLGRESCLKAIDKGNNRKVDIDTLEWYDKKLGIKTKVKEDSKVPETKNQFVNRMTIELKKKYPDLPLKKIQSKASALWKKK